MDIKTADKMQELRKSKGWSQDFLAEKLGLSRQAISKWERGESSPDTDNLIALANLYGVTLDDLLDTKKDAKEIKKTVDKNTQPKKEKKHSLYGDTGRALFKFPIPIVIAIVYVAVGVITKIWHPLWIMFLLIPIYYHYAGACFAKTKKGFLFALPVPEIIIMIYLSIGFEAGVWGVGALVFALIPLYYWVVAFYKTKK